jgi:hypothetical protein
MMQHPGMAPPYGDMYGPPNSQTGIGFGNKPHPYSPSNSAQVDFPPHTRGPSQAGNAGGIPFDPSYGPMGTPQGMQSIPPIPPRSRGSSNLESMESAYSVGNMHHQSPQSNHHPRVSPNIYSSPQPSSQSHYSTMSHLSGVNNSGDYHFMSSFETVDQLHSDSNTNDITEESHYVDGAVHLSAVAKPFVPKYSSPASSTLQVPSLDRSDSSGLSLNASSFSLPPMSLSGQQRSPEATSVAASAVPTANWGTSQDSSSPWNPPRRSPEISLGGFGNDQSDPHSSVDMDNLMNGSLDMLSFDGIVNGLSMSGLGSDELSVDIGESLLGRLTAGGNSSSSSLDRRRNRGLLFQSDSLNYDLGDDSKLGDDDAMMPFNQFLSGVIDSPDMHPSSSYHPHSRLFDRNPS